MKKPAFLKSVKVVDDVIANLTAPSHKNYLLIHLTALISFLEFTWKESFQVKKSVR